MDSPELILNCTIIIGDALTFHYGRQFLLTELDIFDR